jgi:hypothetical protein
VFLVNSRHPLVCAPPPWLPKAGAPFSRSYGGILPSSFNTVLSSALVYSTCPPVSVSGTVYTPGLFPGTPAPPAQSNKSERLPGSVTHGRPRTIHLVPIGYGFRPHLRGRLTLRGLTLRRNPWTSGEGGSHPLDRYSCQHSHFRYLQQPSQATFTGLRNAPLPLQVSDVRNQGSEAPQRPSSPTTCRDNPCSILAISRYSSLQRRHAASSMNPRSKQYRLHTRISSHDPIAM